MTDKITLQNLVTLQNDSTAVAAINSNNAILTLAMDNTLSRDGTSPNQMESVLDMNSNRIINLPTPISITEPTTLGYINSVLAGGTAFSGLISGVPVSAAMQPVVNASTTAQAVQLLGIGSGGGGGNTSIRSKLTQDTTFYVATTGNNNNNGLTPGTAWATPSYAYNFLLQNYDLAGYTVIIQLADGTYIDNVMAIGPLVGVMGSGPLSSNPGAGSSGLQNAIVTDASKGVTFKGNVSSPQNVIMKPAALSGPAFFASNGAVFSVDSISFDMTNAISDTITLWRRSEVSLNNVVFGWNINPWNDVSVSFGSNLFIDGNYTINKPQVQTTLTYGSGATTGTVGSATGLVLTMGINGSDFPAGTYISSIVGTTITWNKATTGNAGSGGNIKFSSGGQTHIDLGSNASLYYNNNGQVPIQVTVLGVPAYPAGFYFVNDCSSNLSQAITFTDGTTTGAAFNIANGPSFGIVRNSVLDTNFEGNPYVPGSVFVTKSATFNSGDTSINVGSTTGLTAGMCVNGFVGPTGTYSNNSNTITVSSNSFIAIGNSVHGYGIPGGTRVTNIVGTTITISQNTTAAGTGIGVGFNGTGIANGTSIATIASGTNITLSQPAVSSQTGITLWFAGLVTQGGQFA